MSQIHFRRINGRIVPIKSKNLSSEDRFNKITSGAGTSVAGLTVGAASGDAAANITKKVARYRFEAEVFADKALKAMRRGKVHARKRAAVEKAGQMAFDFGIKKPGMHPHARFSLRSAMKSKSLKILNQGLKAGGLALSAGLIGHGLKQVYEGVRGKEAGKREEFLSNAAGAGSVFAFHAAYGKKMGIKNWLNFGLKAAKRKFK